VPVGRAAAAAEGLAALVGAELIGSDGPATLGIEPLGADEGNVGASSGPHPVAMRPMSTAMRPNRADARDTLFTSAGHRLIETRGGDNKVLGTAVLRVRATS
jgi:hypothetical protein